MEDSTRDKCNCDDCIYVEDLISTLLQNGTIMIMQSFRFHNGYIKHVPQDNPSAIPCFRVKLALHRQSETRYTSLIVKIMDNRNSPDAKRSFNNEVVFMKNIRNYMRCKFKYFEYLIPLYFYANIAIDTSKRSVIVREYWRIHINHYIIITGKLNENMLHKYIRILAWFHAETFRIRNEHAHIYRYFLHNILIDDNAVERYEQAASAFLNSPVINNLDNILRRNIIRKIHKVKYLQECNIVTLIHGCFTRDAVILKRDMKCGKIIDFQEIMIAPLVIDYGRLVLTNLPDDTSSITLINFISNAWSTYIEHLTELYPKIRKDINLLRQEIHNNLLFSYINLNIDEREAIRNPERILDVLDLYCKY